jgi:hypothetical protein
VRLEAFELSMLEYIGFDGDSATPEMLESCDATMVVIEN